MKKCRICGFYDEDYGCTCPSQDRWYACPIEREKPVNIKELEDYAKWVAESEKTE